MHLFPVCKACQSKHLKWRFEVMCSSVLVKSELLSPYINTTGFVLGPTYSREDVVRGRRGQRPRISSYPKFVKCPSIIFKMLIFEHFTKSLVIQVEEWRWNLPQIYLLKLSLFLTIITSTAIWMTTWWAVYSGGGGTRALYIMNVQLFIPPTHLSWS